MTVGDAIAYAAGGFVAIVFLYVTVRVVFAAIFRSYFTARRMEKRKHD